MKIRTTTLEACPLCYSQNIQLVLISSDFDTDTGEYSIYQCHDCKICFTNPQVDSRDTGLLYSQRTSGEFLPEKSNLIERLRKWRSTVSVNAFFNQLKANEVSILDIGCGDGLYSVALAKHPACYNLLAVDFHETPPRHIANSDLPNINYQRFTHLSQHQSTYDVIFCRHLLEHTANPIDFLHDIKFLLKDSGKVFIEVPNFSCVWRNILGRYYIHLYLPRHFFHFDVQTLKKTIESSGFEVETTFTAHLPSLGWSIRNKIKLLPLRKIGLMELALFPIEIAVNILFRQPTCIGVIIKKSFY